MRTAGFQVAVPIVACLLCGAASAQVTRRMSIATDGTQGNSNSRDPVISANGRYVAFWSFSTNLVPGDANGFPDVFVHDRQSGTTELVSVATGRAQGDGLSIAPSISADGRYVAFESTATNLVAGDTNGWFDVFVRDRQNGITELVSISTGGAQGNSVSYGPMISADGRYVGFISDASNLVSGDTNASTDVFIRDRRAGITERMSISSDGHQANSSCYGPTLSADGRYVAFFSRATNLVGQGTDTINDVFVHDRQTGITERVSVSTGGEQGNGDSDSPSFSADGRFVAFASYSTNLVLGDTNGLRDCFVRDREGGTTERVSVSTGGAQGNSDSRSALVSADGRCVAFQSLSTNLVSGDTNGWDDVFVRDRQGGVTERVSLATDGGQGAGGSIAPSISADGRYVAFESWASNLVSGDTNDARDAFVHDRDASGFMSLCDPGLAGVNPCPCSNPPSGPGRGCDNSAATGGAALSASGIAYLSIESLTFRTAGEAPSALSIVMQGNAAVPGGLVYGQGVRCLGGTMIRRLFIKQALAGSITAPDFGAGDPTVSARSAAKGDVIQPGQSRWYLVYYRDPNVLGGCPASSTFNATQTGQVSWWP